MKSQDIKHAVQSKLPTRRPRRRAKILGRIGTGVGALGVLSAGLHLAYRNRYVEGESTVEKIHELYDGRYVIELTNNLIFVISAPNASEYKPKMTSRVTYKVNRVNLGGGLTAGELTNVGPSDLSDN